MIKNTQSVIRSHKDLIVYQKTQENTLLLFNYYKARKLTWVEKIIIEQLLKAIASIGANIAEGYGRQYKRDYRRFIGIARGSALEVDYWIGLLLEIRPQDIKFLGKISEQNVEVIKILTTLMKNLNS